MNAAPFLRWPARALLVACLVGAGCDALTGKEGASPSKAEAPADAAHAPAGGETKAEAPARPPSLLEGVLPQGIEPAVDGGTTWRVDAYVAALVVEQLRRSPLPFTPWRSDAPAPGQPSEGYRVGALAPDGPWAGLGLREGDIVQAVNGVSTASPEWAAEALRRSDNQVTVSVFRDGVTITLAYRLVGGLAWQALVEPADPRGDEGHDALAVADPPPANDDPADVRSTGVGGGGSGSKSAGGGGGAYDGPYSPSRPSSAPSTGGGGSGSGGGGASGGGGGTVPRPAPPTGSVARCSSAESCSIDKAYFDGLVASPSKLESQADVVPAIANDVHSGYKLRTVKSGTAVHQLGFRSGDKVTHINGHDLTNDAAALQLYLGLANTRTFKVRYERGGSARTKTIKVE
jgi:hypothetical protein